MEVTAAPDPPVPDPPQRPDRPRRRLVLALIALAAILGFLGASAVWAERQALDTDTWTETSSELLEDEEIREAVATFMVDALFANVDVQGEIEGQLPEDLQGLSGPAAAGLRQLADEVAHRALRNPRVQQLWASANRAAHETLLAVVDDDADEDVTLDLKTIVEDIGNQVGIDVTDKLPADAGEIEIVSADDVSTVRDGAGLLRGLAIALTIASLALFAGAVYLADGWRRQALHVVGLALIGAGVAVLIARSLAGSVVTDALASTAAVQPAVANAWEIGTSLLSREGMALVIYGLLVLVAAWLMRPGGAARSTRKAVAPVLEQRGIAYGALLILLVVLFWWAPAEGFEHLGSSLTLIALFVIGLELLRRQTRREFPEQTWEAGSERWRRSLRAMWRSGRGSEDR